MEFRLCFDTIPEQFEKWRIHYSSELFEYLIGKAGIGKGIKVLELGPGTGQATDPILDTGCDYTAIELGKNFAEVLRGKYGNRDNYRLINDDFITHDFGDERFDMIYSAATIQWIDQDIAYSKTFDILKNGGYLAMFYMYEDYRKRSPQLYDAIQKIYDDCFATDSPYTQKFDYADGSGYGYEYLGETEFYGERRYTADEYIEYIKTHSTHIMINENAKDRFFAGVHDAVESFGGIVFDDIYRLHLYRKP